MKKCIFLGLFFICTFSINKVLAQKILKKVSESAKQTTEQKAEQKTSEEVGSGIDKGVEGVKSLFKKKDKKNKNDDVEKQNENQDVVDSNLIAPQTLTPDTLMQQQQSPFGVYTKFTFLPGNKIIFYDDFEKDPLGDFPLKWETNSSGEVVTNSNYEGKWFSVSGRAGYVPQTTELPENYTIEFDMVTNGLTNNNSATSVTLNFLNKKAYNSGAAGGHAHFHIGMSLSASLAIGNTGAENSPLISAGLNRKFKIDTVVHFSIAVNKKRLRIWMGEEKITDIPSLLVGNMGRYLLFETYGVNQEKGHVVLISNFKIAEAQEDLRSKLLDSGRFSTTGIYFNTDKAEIKPESYAIIKSVADYLKENPEVNITIIGHTDAQGANDYNLQLSEKRAQAVIQALVQQFEIDKGRMSAIGKGESEPVDDNTTEKGRANNRRVEFVKK